MPPKKFITFRRSDYSFENIKPYIMEFAEHFKTSRNYFRPFCLLLGRSRRWDVGNIVQNIDRWGESFGRLPGSHKLVDIVRRAFAACQNNDDINHLRGGILEALVIAKYGGSSLLTKNNCGWGAIVHIDGRPIIYTCPKIDLPKCDHRSTVDFGIWNGYHGLFYECKVSPFSVSCKEIQYMRKLSAELTQEGISFELFFAFVESQESIETRQYQAEIAELRIKVFGVEQLSA